MKAKLETLLQAWKADRFWSFKDFAYALRKLGLIVIPTHAGKFVPRFAQNTAGKLPDCLDSLKHAEILRNEAMLILQATHPLRIVEIVDPVKFARKSNVPESMLREWATMFRAHYRGKELIEVQTLYLFLWDEELSLPAEKSKTKEGFKLVSMVHIPGTRLNLSNVAEYILYQVNSGKVYTKDDLKSMHGKWLTFWKSASKRTGRPPEKWEHLRKDLAKPEVQAFLENMRVKKILFVLYEYQKPILLSKLIRLANVKYEPGRHVLKKLLKLRLVQRVFKGYYKLTEAGIKYVQERRTGLKWEMPVKLLKKFRYLPKDFKKAQLEEMLRE